MPDNHARVIVNPTAGARKTYRHWPHIQSLLRSGGLSFDFRYTEGTGHATVLAREAASDGCRFVVAVGGDGTINEVANGVLTAASPEATTIGIISTGTGNDFVKSVGAPRDFAGACRCVSGGSRRLIDVGLVEYSQDGERRQRYFVNGAGIGFDAEVTEAAEKMPKRIGHTVPFVMGLLRTLPKYRNKHVRVSIDGKTEDRVVLSVIVSNGAYFGGGMKIAPTALPHDRLFDVVTVGDIGKLELLKVFPRVYSGTHIAHPAVKIDRAETVFIESSDRILLQADGELLGHGPVTFRVVPQALSLAV